MDHFGVPYFTTVDDAGNRTYTTSDVQSGSLAESGDAENYVIAGSDVLRQVAFQIEREEGSEASASDTPQAASAKGRN